MSKEIDKVFIDVRNAFRLLNSYQNRILDIVNYIREQTDYTDMWGSRKWYSEEIGNKNSPDSSYAKLNLSRDKCSGWNFLYGHFFEYYFGQLETEDKRIVEMSVFQVSDDGYFISNDINKSMDNVSKFKKAEESHSYIVLNMTVTNQRANQIWLHDPKKPEEHGPKDFLTKFLSSANSTKVTIDSEDNVSVIKKYEMQRFATQKDADAVIHDFGKIVFEQTNIRLFKDSFYDNEV